MNVSLTPELEAMVDAKVESGMYIPPVKLSEKHYVCLTSRMKSNAFAWKNYAGRSLSASNRQIVVRPHLSIRKI